MELDSRIYVAGHSGLAGGSILRALRKLGCVNLITASHSELDLTDQKATESFFREHMPEYVVLAAARVGGIHANNTYPAQFIHENLIIQDNVIHQAYVNGVKRLVFLGSSCIYPRDCPQPMKEEYLLTGPLEPTNRPYAVAKIAGIETCWSYNRQYSTSFIAVMPTNLYGPGDNYNAESAHVLPALLRRIHEAKQTGANEVVAWGSGQPRREFLYSDDMAAAVVRLLTMPQKVLSTILSDSHPPLVNVGTGEDLTIRELAMVIAEVVGFTGKIRWDDTKPDGTPRKLQDVTRIKSLGWRPEVPFREGLERVYHDFLGAEATRL